MSVGSSPDLYNILNTILQDTAPHSMSELYNISFADGSSSVSSGEISLLSFKDKTINTGGPITYPTVALTGNSSNGYTVNASRDTANAYKAFNDNTGDYWQIGTSTVYNNGSPRGIYLGSTEKIPGYLGEWIELILPNQIFLTELQIYCSHSLFLPRRSYTFGSNDGIAYYLIHDSGDKGYLWGTYPDYNTIFTRTPDTANEDPYSRILIIAESLSGGNVMGWNDINIIGITD